MEKFETENYDLLFKLVIVGDSSVGKSNIFSKYLKGTFDKNWKETIGAQFGSKTIEVNNKNIKLQIWDTTGNENYSSFINGYYKGALGAFIIYDVTNKSSFDNVEKWLMDLRKNGNENISILLIGNKSDLINNREVSMNDGLNKSEKLNISFIETSALNGDNIIKAFYELINLIFQNNNNFVENSEYYNKVFIDAPPPTPHFQGELLKNINITCTECPSDIEILSVNEEQHEIKFRCLNNKSHGIKNMNINEYFEKIKKFKNSNIDEYKEKCKIHFSSKNNIYISYCLDCNIHLCQECLRKRNHFNHNKNNIIEIQPTEEELNIIDEVTKYYQTNLLNLKNEQKLKTKELQIILENKRKEEKYKFIKSNKIYEINKNKELKEKNSEYLSDINEIKRKYEKEIKLKENQFKQDIKIIKNKYNLIKMKEEIYYNKQLEKLNKKYNDDLNSYQFKEKIEKLNNIIKINQFIFNIYQVHNNNYFNAININNLLLSYNNNKYIKDNIIDKMFNSTYNETLKMTEQKSEEKIPKKKNTLIITNEKAKINERKIINFRKEIFFLKNRINQNLYNFIIIIKTLLFIYYIIGSNLCY